MHHLLLPTVINQDHPLTRQPETADAGSVWMLVALAVIAATIVYTLVTISH